jgi:hypothetical protein
MIHSSLMAVERGGRSALPASFTYEVSASETWSPDFAIASCSFW